MNGNTELPPDHFWDSEEAEDEYYAVKSGIAEAEARLAQAENRLVIFQAVAYTFSEALSKAADRSLYEVNRPLIDSSSLSHIFNPFWLGRDGNIRDSSYAKIWKGRALLQGNLILRKVERRIIEDKWGGISYNCEERTEWYTPLGEAAKCHLEYNLRHAPYPFKTRWSYYDKLLEEVIGEVHAFSEALSKQLLLKFHPEIPPPEVEVKDYNFVFFKIKHIQVTPRQPKKRPMDGNRMLDSGWTLHGRWTMHEFPGAALSDFVNSIQKRLKGNIMAAARSVIHITGETEKLSRKREKIRILHYKPLVFQQFWSLIGTGSAASEPETSETDANTLLPETAAALIQIPKVAQSRLAEVR